MNALLLASLSVALSTTAAFSASSSWASSAVTKDRLFSTTLTAAPVAKVAEPNDSFAQRTIVTGNYLLVTNVLAEAARERGEPRHGSRSLGKSLWWSWTAPASGVAYIAVQADDFDPLIAVYTGSTVRTLRPVTRFRRAGSVSGIATVQFQAVAGTSYEFAIDGAARPETSLSMGRFILGFTFSTLRITSPTNNLAEGNSASFIARISEPHPELEANLEKVEYILADSFGRTKVAGESTNAPFSATLTSPTGGEFLLIAVARTTDGAELVTPPVRFNLRPEHDDFASAKVVPGYHQYSYSSTAGATRESGERSHGGGGARASVWYAWTAPASGTAAVRLHYSSKFRFDVYTGADLRSLTRVPGKSIRTDEHVARDFDAVAGTTYYVAVDKPGVVGHLEGETDFTIEFELVTTHLTSPASGAIFIVSNAVPLRIETTERPEEIASVEYLAGHPFIGLSVIATITNAPYEFDWPARSGEYIVSARLNKTDGTILGTETVGIIVRPANDNFADRFFLGGTNLHVATDYLAASSEPDEPAINTQVIGQGSIWFSWTAPANGILLVESRYGAMYQPIHLFRGETLATLQPVTNFVFNPFDQWRVVVTNGETIHIAVLDGGELKMDFYSAPGNDSFADRTVLAGTNLVVTGNNMFASTEPGEPAHESGRGRSVWFTWTADRPGIVLLYATNTPVLLGQILSAAVYVGSNVTTLSRITEGPLGPVAFNVLPATTYQIAIDDRSYGVYAYELRLVFEAAPPNDNFADRLVLSGVDVPFIYNSHGASLETNEPPHRHLSCWWSWTAPATGPVTLEGRLAPIEASVYTGSSLASLVTLTSTDYKIYLQATQGVTYHLALSTFFGYFNAYEMRLLQADNDQFTNARIFVGLTNTLRGTMYGASAETGEPAMDRNSVWWTWTAPADAVVTLRDFSGNSRPPRMAAYTGTALTNLRLVAGQQFEEWPGSRLTFTAVAGVTYQLSLWGHEDYLLSFEAAPGAASAKRVDAASTIGSLSRGKGFFEFGADDTGAVETSTNLVDWQPLVIAPTNGRIRFSTTNAPQHFFRVRPTRDAETRADQLLK